ncbi:uncharacterized protein LOC126683482 [Mercurialis annua]|uniref:uncharacterized protein LOC126683482 n=1 Tax=Mercurialis annua TaxID=3986 RepID=UPI002160464A|nr:uncharacterized protein LOC126683482 [Mercurialis annua]
MVDTHNHQVPRKKMDLIIDQDKIEKKEIIIPKDYQIDLHIQIHFAEGLDNPNIYPDVKSRFYKVVFSVNSENEYETPYEIGLPNPIWINQKYRIRLNKFMDIRFLYVEVVRCGVSGSESDPESSNGRSVVGRARIPLPKVTRKKSGRYGLVRCFYGECKAEGHVGLTLEMKKIVKKERNYYIF